MQPRPVVSIDFSDARVSRIASVNRVSSSPRKYRSLVKKSRRNSAAERAETEKGSFRDENG